MPIRGWLLSTTALGAFGASWVASIPGVAQAGDLTSVSFQPDGSQPAVSSFNSKWDGLGGTLGNETVAGGRGSLSWPLAAQYGLQVDGFAGTLNGDFLGGAAAHLFWRNPAVGLIGVYADDMILDRFGGVNATHVAFEGVRYWGNWSFGGIAGVEFGNSQSSTSVVPGGTLTDTYDVKTRFFDQIDLSYYLTDNLKLSVGHRYLGGKEAAAFGGEWAFALGHGVMGSVFAEGFAGESDFHGVWGGLRVYFGPQDKPLRLRQRQDDPDNYMPSAVFTITNSESHTFMPSPPSSPPPSPPPYVY